MKRKPGRPHKIDTDRKRISLDEALKFIATERAKVGLKPCSKGHLYNMISKGTLSKATHNFGVLLYEDEVREKLCG